MFGPPTQDLACGTASMEAPGILVLRLTPGTTIGADEMEAVLAAVLSFRARLVLTDARGIAAATRAGLLAGANQTPEFVVANAVVTRGAVAPAIVNMFLHVFKPPFHARLFRDEPNARSWLEGFLTGEPSGDRPPMDPAGLRPTDGPLDDDEFCLVQV